MDVTTLLPADGSSEGFDNIAEALSVSPSLIQGYVSAAMKISRQAVGDRTLAPSQISYSVPGRLAQDRHIDGLPIGTRGGMLIQHTFPLDAEYDFSVGGGGGGGGGIAGGAAIDVTLDGETIEVDNPRTFRLPITAGPHVIGVAVVDRLRGAGVDEIYSDFRIDAAFTPAGGVNTVTITGPFNATGVGDTPSRRRIFVCRPKAPADDTACARQIMTTLARRAYRGPVSAAEIDTLMGFYQQGRKEEDFENGIQQALARVLVAPRFVYRAEEEPPNVAAGTVYRISDVDLASRLSFLLWSSIPDDELLDAAVKNRLRDPKELERQVRRMLADPRSDALISNFAGQWLYLRELEGVQTDAKNFNDNLRQAFRRETEMLFGAIVREDRSLLDLIDADFTYVDERLARHYGIPECPGQLLPSRPARPGESAPRADRAGQLSDGDVGRHADVARCPAANGSWRTCSACRLRSRPRASRRIWSRTRAVKPVTLRQRLEAHRANPVCASCHKVMDPMGFALENFDLVGTWRDREGEAPIDSSGQLADGTAAQRSG